jgi:hypothetical protein
MRKNQEEFHAVQRGILRGGVEILGQCSLACFDQVRKTFKNLKEQGVRFNPNILQHIPPEKVAMKLLELMGKKFSLEEIKVAYKAVWGFDRQEELDDELCWEDALLSPSDQIKVNFYTQCRLDPALSDRAITVSVSEKVFETFQPEAPELLWGANNNTAAFK